MVTETCDQSRENRRFVIRPNRSLSWTAAKRIFCGIVLLSLTIALGFASIGLWPILPFAGLELLALGSCLFICAHRAGHCEVITVNPTTVRVEKGKSRPELHWDFPRAWVGVALQRSAKRSYPSRLVLRSHGKGLEVGSFLTEPERLRLATDLRAALKAVRG